jgi:Uncharacterized protein conserved in bacteria
MLFSLVACGITGVTKFPELDVQLSSSSLDILSLVHDWAGAVGLVFAIAHVLLHAKWFVAAPKAIFGPVRKEAKAAPAPSGASSEAPALARSAKRGAGVVALVLALLVVLPGPSAWARGRHLSNPTVPQGLNYPAGSLKDGVYAGSATGYMPGLSVEVTVKGGAIASVRITDNNETPRWLRMVQSLIPQRIVSGQSTAVDAVSGATSSSLGIMSAVEDALKKAANP